MGEFFMVEECCRLKVYIPILVVPEQKPVRMDVEDFHDDEASRFDVLNELLVHASTSLHSMRNSSPSTQSQMNPA